MLECLDHRIAEVLPVEMLARVETARAEYIELENAAPHEIHANVSQTFLA